MELLYRHPRLILAFTANWQKCVSLLFYHSSVLAQVFGLVDPSAPFACSNANLAEGTGPRRLQKFAYTDPTTPPWPP
jgi:hypothetical protein